MRPRGSPQPRLALVPEAPAASIPPEPAAGQPPADPRPKQARRRAPKAWEFDPDAVDWGTPGPAQSVAGTAEAGPVLASVEDVPSRTPATDAGAAPPLEVVVAEVESSPTRSRSTSSRRRASRPRAVLQPSLLDGQPLPPDGGPIPAEADADAEAGTLTAADAPAEAAAPAAPEDGSPGVVGAVEASEAVAAGEASDEARHRTAARRPATEPAPNRAQEARMRQAAEKAERLEQEARAAAERLAEAEARVAEAARLLEAEKEARRVAEARAFEESVRHGEERKARIEAERQLREQADRAAAEERRAREPGALPPQPAPAKAALSRTGEEGDAPGVRALDAASVFGKMGGAERTPDPLPETGGDARKAASQTLSLPPLRPGEKSRTVQVSRGTLAPPRHPQAAPRPQGAAPSAEMRGRLTLGTISAFRNDPEKILERAQEAEARQPPAERRAEAPAAQASLPAAAPAAAAPQGPDDRARRIQERIAANPLVQEVMRAVSLADQMEGKPEIAGRVGEVLAAVRRKLHTFEMRVMGATAAVA